MHFNYPFKYLQVATIITRWGATTEYSYGYLRAEILGGFINGLALIFVALHQFKEAIHRLAEPPEVKHERLLVVSILGFIVNLIGIFIFQHGGDSHGHSHDGHTSANYVRCCRYPPYRNQNLKLPPL